MNKLLPFAISAALLCVCLGACTHHSVILQMERAEALMDSHPDSSLMILDSIQRKALHGIAARAKFALLRSQALDKTYCDLQSDSIIAPAADYYEHFGTDREKLLSRYYLGRIEQNSGHSTSAIEIFLDAEPYAVRSGDHFYTGLLYGSIGMLYFTQNQFDKALEYYDRAYISYERAGKRDYMADILVAKGHVCINTDENVHWGIEFYRQGLRIAKEVKDIQVQASAFRGLSMTYYDINPNLSYKYIDSLYKILNYEFTIEDYITLSAIYTNINKLDSAEYLIRTILPYIQNDRLQYIRTRKILKDIYLNRGEYTQALIYNDQYQKINDSLLLNNQYNTILDKETEICRIHTLETQKKDIRILIFLFCTLMLSITILTSYLIRYKNKKEKQEFAMRKALSNKYDFFNMSAETIYESYSEEKTCRKIDDMLKEILKEEIFIDMEESLNAQHDDIFKRISEKVRLSEKDYRLMLLICCGFGSHACAAIFDAKPETLYKNKSRAIEKLEKSGIPGIDRIIAIMKGRNDSPRQKKAQKRSKKTAKNSMSGNEKRVKA